MQIAWGHTTAGHQERKLFVSIEVAGYFQLELSICMLKSENCIVIRRFLHAYGMTLY